MAIFDLGGGKWADTDARRIGYSIPDEYGNLQTQEYMDDATYNQLVGVTQQPWYISGRAEAERQAAADKDFDFGGLIEAGIKAAPLMMLTGGALGAFGGALGGAGAFGAGELLGGAESLSGLSATNSLAAAGMSAGAAGTDAFGVGELLGGGESLSGANAATTGTGGLNVNDIIENVGNVIGGDTTSGTTGTGVVNNDIIENVGNVTGGDTTSGTTGTGVVNNDIIEEAGNVTGGEKTGGTTTGGATTTAAKSLWNKFVSDPTPETLASLLGGVAPGLLREYFKNQQSNNLTSSLTTIANQARADRSPFLDYAKSSLAGGPEAYAATGAGGGALRGVLNKLSVQGNPIGNPGLLGIATDSANRTWQDDWRQAANIGLGGNYSQLATNAAQAGQGTSGSGFGDAAASVFGTKNSLEDFLKNYNSLNGIFGVKP